MGKVENLGLNNSQGWEKEKTQGLVKNKVGNSITSPNNNPGLCKYSAAKCRPFVAKTKETAQKACLCQSGPLDKIVEFSYGAISWQRLQILKHVLLFGLEKLPVGVIAERLVPERPQVDPADFGGVEDLAQGPHEGAVDPHQLLGIYHVGLVQNNFDFVFVTFQGLNALSELVGYVELVGVEEKKNSVHSLGKPLKYASEVIP